MDRVQARRARARVADARERREIRRIRRAYRDRARDPRYVRWDLWNDRPEGYKVSRSEMFMDLARRFGRPIQEIKEIVGVRD